jgi:hypothetical protein
LAGAIAKAGEAEEAAEGLNHPFHFRFDFYTIACQRRWLAGRTHAAKTLPRRVINV